MNRRAFCTLAALCLSAAAWAGTQYVLYSHAGSVSGVATDGKALFSGSADYRLCRYDLATATKKLWVAHKAYVSGVSLAKNGALLASVGGDSKLCLWNPTDGSALASPISLDSEPLSVAAAPDGQKVAVGCRDGSVRLYTVSSKTWKLLGKHNAGSDLRVLSVAYSPDGKTVASGGVDKRIGVWDTASQALRGWMTGHTGTIYGLTFCPDDGALVSTADDATVRLWNVSSLASIGVGRLPSGVSLLGFESIAVSPDGKTILTGSNDSYAMVWWKRSGSSVTTSSSQLLELNGDDTNTVAFISNSEAASGSADLTVRKFPVGLTGSYKK